MTKNEIEKQEEILFKGTTSLCPYLVSLFVYFCWFSGAKGEDEDSCPVKGLIKSK